jgi:glycosyltransferase involved in cell wall biosynthesis
MKSIISQTILPDEIVIVLDGAISDEVNSVLDKYLKANPKLYVIVPLEKNVGLGLALREGVLHCNNELIARMDTDDISRKDRFEQQLKAFQENPNIDICGGQILEFEDDINNIVSKRTVPLTHNEIIKYQKRRDAFNHMTVMYKKSAVLRAGNYKSCLFMEDDLLWCNMFKTGAIGQNLGENLVYVRVGKDLYKRRGGLKYYRKYKQARKEVYKTGFISWWDYKYTTILQFVVAIMPSKMREYIFKKKLHKL